MNEVYHLVSLPSKRCYCGCGQITVPGQCFINGHESYDGVNKSSSIYFGCDVAERVLLRVFENVKRMPFGNQGFDFICNKGYKVDVKSSTIRNEKGWTFSIKRNEIPDYFLCIAFDNRDELNPLHLWLIPGEDVNHKTGITISKSKIDKWSKYEQPVDRVLDCCNDMKVVKLQ